MEPRETRFSKCPMIDTFFRYPVSSFIVIFTDRHQFKLSPNKNTSEHALHIHTCTLHCRRLKRVTHTHRVPEGNVAGEPKAPPPNPHFSQTARAAASKVSSGVDFRAKPHPVLPTQRKAPAWPPGTPTWPQHPGGPSSWPPKPETKPPGLNPTPRPVPSWFHPPMALPPPPKEELKEPSWTGATGGATKEELEEGVTPPMMSPLAAAAAGAGEGGGGQGLQGLDPRHLLHLLTRKVGNYSPLPRQPQQLFSLNSAFCTIPSLGNSSKHPNPPYLPTLQTIHFNFVLLPPPNEHERWSLSLPWLYLVLFPVFKTDFIFSDLIVTLTLNNV